MSAPTSYYHPPPPLPPNPRSVFQLDTDGRSPSPRTPLHFQDASPSPRSANGLSGPPLPSPRLLPPPYLAPLVPFTGRQSPPPAALPSAGHACHTFAPHNWQPDVCRECGHNRSEHTLTQPRSRPHPPPVPRMPSAPLASPTARFNPLTYGHIPTFHLQHQTAAVSASTFDAPPTAAGQGEALSPRSPRLRHPGDMNAFAVAVAAAAERRKTSHVPPPLPPHLVAIMQGQMGGSGSNGNSLSGSLTGSGAVAPVPPAINTKERRDSGATNILSSPKSVVATRTSSVSSTNALTTSGPSVPSTPQHQKRASNAGSPIARLADYFLVIGRGAPIFDRPANAFSTAAPAAAIPPPPSLFGLRFHPVVLPDQRYPLTDMPETPLTTTINLFAFPSFHSLLLLPLQSMSDAAHPLWLSRRPRCHSFVLTKVNGQKQYGTCLTFFERVSEREKEEMIAQIVTAYAALVTKKGGQPVDEAALSGELHSQLEQHVLFQPKCLCILSMWPFFSLFTAFLKSLFRVSCLSLATTALALANGDRPAPILSFPLPLERYILNFVVEIPVPPPGLLRLRCVMPDSTALTYCRPAHNRLPLCDSDYRCLFRVLSADNVALVWSALCLEQKTLLVSSSYSLLTTVAETLTSLLFPFYWSSIYMPFVPEAMLDFLHAPVPFFSGVHTTLTERDGFMMPDDTVVVYLDRNEVVVPADEGVTVVGLGDKDGKKLAAHLRRWAVVGGKVVEGVDVNVSDWAYPHGEDLQPILLDDDDHDSAAGAAHNGGGGEALTRPQTPVSSVNSLVSSWSPRSGSPSAISLSPSTSHTRSHSVFSLSSNNVHSVPQTPTKPAAPRSMFNFSSPTQQSGASTPADLPTSPTSHPPAANRRTLTGYPSSNGGSASLSLFGSQGGSFNADEVRYGFLRVFVKLMQNYRKYMPNPSPTSAPSGGGGNDEPSVSRLDSSLDDVHDTDDPPSQSQSSSQPPLGRKREWMNVDRFVSDTPASLRPFCALFVQTQLFARFIDDRIAVDLELKAKEEARAESEAAFLRARGVLNVSGSGERREPPASAIKALGEMGLDKKASRAMLQRYPGAWSSHETAVDFALQLTTWHKEREVREREEWESGGKKKSLFDLDTDPTQMKTHDQILFFDECILAKHNRHASLGRRPYATPFLSDLSSHLYVPFIPAPPSYVGSGEEEWFMPQLGEEGGVVFPVLDKQRWGERKVSDLIWMEGGEKGRRWEAKMSEKRKKIEKLREEEREREDRERKRREKEQGNFMSRLFKSKQSNGGDAAAQAVGNGGEDEGRENIELYASPGCGLKIEGRKKQWLPRCGDRTGRSELRSPRALLAAQQAHGLVPIRSMFASSKPSMSPSPTTTPAAALTHHRSLSSHPILLSTGPPLSSLPVHLGPSTATRLSRAEAVLASTKGSVQAQPRKDMADSAATPTKGVLQPAGTAVRRLSASRSTVETESIRIHPYNGNSPPPVTVAAAANDAHRPVGSTAGPSPPPLPNSAPPPLPKPAVATPAPPPAVSVATLHPVSSTVSAPASTVTSPTAAYMRKSPPPVPTKPARAAVPSLLSLHQAANHTPAASASPPYPSPPPPAGMLSPTQPELTRSAPALTVSTGARSSPSPSPESYGSSGSSSDSTSVAFVIRGGGGGSGAAGGIRSRSNSAHSNHSATHSPQPYHTPNEMPPSPPPVPSPRPITPMSPAGAVGSDSGRGRVVMRTRPLPAVPTGGGGGANERGRSRSASAKRKESREAKEQRADRVTTVAVSSESDAQTIASEQNEK